MAKANAAKPINLIISFLPCLRLLAQVLHASTLRQIKSSIRLLRSAWNLSHNATSDEGQTRKYSPQHMFSAVPLTTDIQRLLRHVRKVPSTEVGLPGGAMIAAGDQRGARRRAQRSGMV
jgi:hypothetical protein